MAASLGAAGCGGEATSTGAGSGGGGSDSAASGGAAIDVSADEYAQYCDAYVKRDVDCYGDSSTVADCQKQYPCFVAFFAPHAQRAFLDCDTTRPCQGKSDDDCYEEAATKAGLSTKGTAYIEACNAFASKNQQGEGCGDLKELCGGGDFPAKILNDAIYNAITPCFNDTCAAAIACVMDALKKVEASCEVK